MLPTTASGNLNLDYPLIALDGGVAWTLRDSFEGVQIFGSTGSGKSSGSGRHLAMGLLKAGLGGLVLTVKPDERVEWERYAALAGRSGDVIVFGPDISTERPYSFGFFEYERRVAAAEGIPFTESIVNLFSVIMEVSQRKSGAGTQDAYWIFAVRQMLRNAVDLLSLAGFQLTFDSIYRLITSAPTSPAAIAKLTASVSANPPKSTGLFSAALLTLCANGIAQTSEGLLKLTLAYWLSEYVSLAPETRSSIVSFFTTVADTFMRGTLSQLFSPASSNEFELEPELTHRGKIIIVDLPIKKHFETGQFAQVLYKFIWQRAAERRQKPGAPPPRPIFLWADEAQFFVNSHDMLFQTTARSAQVATVFLTQSISNYYAVMEGDRAKPETDSLLGNFQTKIFHANSDAVTNAWAADLIGKNWQFRRSLASSYSSSLNDPAGRNLFSLRGLLSGAGKSTATNVNRSKNELLEYQVLPLEFSRLKKGGKANSRQVEAIFTQGGRVLPDGRIYQKLIFQQKV